MIQPIEKKSRPAGKMAAQVAKTCQFLLKGLGQHLDLKHSVVEVENIKEHQLEGDDQFVDLPDRPAQAGLQQALQLTSTFLGDRQQLVGAKGHQILDLQKLDRGSQKIERGSNKAGAQMAHFARQIAVAAPGFGQKTECCEPDGLAGDEAVVTIHETGI